MGKLAKRLRKDLTANPKQAAVLGLLCLVAIWFWSPLVLRWLKPKAVPVVAAVSPASETVTSPVATEAAATATPKSDWRSDTQRRAAHPLTQPSAGTTSRDPFYRKTVAPVAEVPEPVTVVVDELPPPVENEASVALKNPGLVVESIAYGSTRRRAQISGQTVKERDAISSAAAASNADETPTAVSAATYTVKSIQPNYVVLDYQGQELRLDLKTKPLGRGEIFEHR